MRTRHETEFQGILKALIATAPTADNPAVDSEAVADTGSDAAADLNTFESVAALEAQDGPFGKRSASEITGVEIIKGKSGRIYLLSADKREIIPKYSLVGGYGTGKPF